MSDQKTDPWYKSKTKVGGVLLGISTMAGAVGGYLTGITPAGTAAEQFLAGLSAVLIIFGIRNAVQK